MTTGANILAGRALARNGALTLDTNQITRPSGCGNPVACNQGAGNDVDKMPSSRTTPRIATSP